MGIVEMGVPKSLVLKILEKVGLEVFVETGTYYGSTALWASQQFKQVFTIEFSQKIYESVSKKYSNINNIKFLFGDTREQIKLILNEINQPCLFWLDAHWSGGDTYGINDECPILQELEIINNSKFNHFILIDDARLFIEPPPPPHQASFWPNIQQITDVLNSGAFARFTSVVDDVIISVPENFKSIVQDYENNETININSTKENQVFKSDGEYLVTQSLIHDNDVVFDVGANVGNWTKMVLTQHQNTHVHLFEPVPQLYQELLQNHADSIKTAQIFPNNVGVSDKQNIQTFYFYETMSSWSTFYRQFDVEKQYQIAPPKTLPVMTITLDDYCERWNIHRINFLKIDTEGSELSVLHGARKILQKGQVDYIQFEYGGNFSDAKVTLKEVFDCLQKHNYFLFKILPDSLEYRPVFLPEFEDFAYSNFLAVNERLKSSILGETPQMLDLAEIFAKNSIKPKGVIHVGAYEGNEVQSYKNLGIENILFIEANPQVFKRLEANVSNIAGVQVINCAISNQNGELDLHITSSDQSSSILPLKKHSDYYSSIYEVEKLKIQSKTLDTLLEELKLNPSDFNILNIDIQGAELLALQGATQLLKNIDAINTEVNYEELYEGCALINQIDDFLESQGFQRIATTCPYHWSWGDAFYIKKPVITMSTLGKNGRFANQLFQYAFLKIYAKQHNLRLETPPWIGQEIFGYKDPAIRKELPQVLEQVYKTIENFFCNSHQPFKNVDFQGTFQFPTKYYSPYKDYFRSLFKPLPNIEKKLDKALNTLYTKGKTIVGLHLRRGDFGHGYFFVARTEWYKEWLKDIWESLDSPVLFIASDEIEKVIDDFSEYSPITSQDLVVDIPFYMNFYIDFYLLSKCDFVAISNSSFSFLSCLLNDQGKYFYRPHLLREKLIPFNPWNSQILLKDQDSGLQPIPTILSRIETTGNANLIIFPDWQASEAVIIPEIVDVIKAIIEHPAKDYITLMIYVSDISEDQANDILFDGVIQFLMEENLDIKEGPHISIISNLSKQDWSELLPSIHARIILKHENEKISNLLALNFLSFYRITKAKNKISSELYQDKQILSDQPVNKVNNIEFRTNPIMSKLEKTNSNYLEIAIQEFQEGNFVKSLEMYQKAMQNNINLIEQGLGVNFAHTLILATDWEEISRNLPAGINYLEASGWLNSLWASKPLNKELLAIPWYTYPAIEFLENKIDQNWKIFEFGSGQSTLWWAERVTEVISLENDQNWFYYIQGNMPTNVSLYLEENETEYATKISNYPDNYFDIVIIDGANRNECAKFTLNKVKDKGFIIFDNTDNYEFDLGVNLLLDNGYHKIDFYGLIPGYTYKNCTSIFFKDFAILSDKKLPSKKQSCLGLSCFQVTNPESKNIIT